MKYRIGNRYFMLKANVVYADFPHYHSSHNGNLEKAKSNNMWGLSGYRYKKMTWKQISEFPISDYCDSNCALFIWSSPPVVKRYLNVIESWGFKYRTFAFVWVKQNKSGTEIKPYGLGHYTLSNIEFVLLATRGKFIRNSKSVKQVVLAPLRSHSEKPDEVRDRIVQLCGDVPRTELFARKEVTGWNCIGDEIGKPILLAN